MLDALFVNSAETVVVAGSDGTIRYATAGVATLVGRDVTSAVGRSILDFVHDDVQAFRSSPRRTARRHPPRPAAPGTGPSH